MTDPIGLAAIEAAAERIAPWIVRTPLERSPELGARLGAEVWLKWECFQRTGSFKLRGALNALLQLDPADRRRGVVAASAGNHALGVAWAAERTGSRATVVVPATPSPAKLAALAHAGVEVIRHGSDYDAAEASAIRLAAGRGVRYLSPYNDPAVIAGGGTIGLEILAEQPDLDAVVVPVGGGGLIAGIGLAIQARRPDVAVFGVQSDASPAVAAALAAGAIVPVTVRPSLADGLAGNLEPGSRTVAIVRRTVERVVVIEEAAIAPAIRFVLDAEHVVIEGSAAVGIAAALTGRLPLAGRRVAFVLTGRNLAPATPRAILAAGGA